MIRDPDTATLWLIRGGDKHRLVPTFIAESMIGVGFPAIPDGTHIDLARATRYLVDDHSAAKPEVEASMFCSFVRGIEEDDVVLLPDPAMGGLVVGWVAGPYRFEEDLDPAKYRHRRDVEWIKRVPYTALGERLEDLPKTRVTLKKVDDGFARTLVRRAAFEDFGDDPNDRKGAKAVRTSTPRVRKPAGPPKATIDTQQCAGCLMTKRVELFEAGSSYCVDCG